MVFVGNGLLYAMRINVSVTMAAMTNATYTTFDHGEGYNQTVETCPKPNNSTESTNENGEFLWTAHQQELIIAGFFYGYSVSQIPAGWLTDKIGGTRVFGFGMFISGISSLLGPTAAWMGPEFLLAIRIFCGFFETGKIAIPVKSIILSIPVWAIIICSFVGTWANNVVFTNQPIYLKHVQGMNIELIGILSSIPFLAEGGMLVLCSKLAIKLINEKTLSVVATRKLLTAIGLGLTAGSFLLLAYVGCNSALSVVLMISATGFNGIASSGYYVNLMDIAPRFAGSLLGFVNTSSAISGALTPYVIGVFTTNQADILGWQTVFFISTGLTLLAALVYSILGSGEVQEWAKSSNEETL
ncbi:putative inorganic phosphate cotransporter [Lytechinus variegatus]|uniref:putative inorganic phosphate cotransporter n=1 Tax=Lytechinus variegatus TaxID=7654 RepID=UPI001BB28ACB|nr:putative inorganic phosphate cotransporter [Lytechinus variegatus]